MGFAIPVGLAILGAVTSAQQAKAHNKAISASIKSQRSAAAAQGKQISEQAALEKLKRQREAEQVRGRLRVAAGEAGVGTTGSFGALLRQSDFDLALNQSIIEKNRESQAARVASEFRAGAISTAAQGQNVGLSTLSGGLAGLSTGISIQSAIKSLGDQLKASREAAAAQRDATRITP